MKNDNFFIQFFLYFFIFENLITFSYCSYLHNKFNFKQDSSNVENNLLSKSDQVLKSSIYNDFILIIGIIGLIFSIIIATIYIQNKYKKNILFLSTKKKNEQCLNNSFDDLINLNENIINKKKEEIKSSNSKTKGFLIRAMTLPQDVIRTVGKTVQLNSNTNLDESYQNSIKQCSISLSDQQLCNLNNSNSYISTTCIPVNQNSNIIALDKPLNFKKSIAFKSLNTSFSKKNPSPTENNNLLQIKSIINNNINEASNTRNKTNNIDDDLNRLSSIQEINHKDLNQNLDTDNSKKLDLIEKNLAKIQFNLKYNYEKHALYVFKIKCQNLPAKNNIDTFVKLQLLPEKQYKMKTRTIKKNLNPEYEEEFTFFNISPDQLDFVGLHFTIIGFDRYSRDEVLGEALHQLEKTQFDTLEKQVCVAQDLYPKGILSRLSGRGELLVSLCYHPVANRLSLVVLKARNLPKMDLNGLSDPYVKIGLFFNNKRIAKKKTRVKKKTLNPVFNETFLFDLPLEINQSNYQIEENKSSIEYDLWKQIKLELTLLDYDRVTRNETIGNLILFLDSEEASIRKHLLDIITSPRKQIASWHKIF